MIKHSLISVATSMLLIGSLQAESLVHDELLNVGSYNITGTFGAYDFTDAEPAFDWAFTSNGVTYQLQGKEATDTDLFGWLKDESITTPPDPAWLMFPIAGDEPKFDWVMVQPQDSGAVFKLEGVTDEGNFDYSDKIEIPYTINNNKVTFGTVEEEATPPVVEDGFKFSKEYLDGKTLYLTVYDDFGYEEGEESGKMWRVASLKFSGTTVTISEIYHTQNPNVPYDVKYDITDYGNIKIIDFNNSGENEISFLKALSKTEKQIEICITEDFAECFGNEFLLFSEQDAKDFADAKNAEEPFKFSTEYLNGKTLYNTSCDDNQWQMAPFSFNDKTFTAYIEEDPTQRMDDVSYNITQEGYINFENEGDKSYIKALETTSIAMSVCWEDSVENATKCSWSNEYFYFDYETAKKLVDTKNANEDFEGCHGDDGGHSESRECEVGVDGCEEVTVSGKVIFKDAEGNIIDTPEDARVRLSSDVDMENNHYGKYFNNITLSPQGDFSATAKVQPNSYQSGHKINVDIYKENGEEPHYYNCGENSYKGTLINFDELQSLEVTPNDFQDNSSQTCD